MIEGVVNDKREVTVPVRLRSWDGTVHNVTAVIDTGYDGYVIVPPSLADGIGTRSTSRGRAKLADGSVVWQQRFEVELFWDGQFRICAVLAIGSDGLLGMMLFDDYEIYIKGGPGGIVEVRPIIAPNTDETNGRGNDGDA